MKKKTVTALFALTILPFSTAVMAPQSEAQTLASPKILGGSFENLQQRPIAYIQSSFGSCTGTLVGTITVLTAAHCVPEDAVAEDYSIKLGGEFYGVQNGFVPAAFNQNVTSMANSRFDIALLILDREVTSLTPYPILINDPVKKNETGRMFGYGLNELVDPGADLSLNGKSAAAVVSAVPDGVISTNLVSSEGAVCSGDSGGPLTQTIENQIAVVGVTSTGASVDQGQQCIRNGTTVSNFVNLQSNYAKAFLAEFPNIQFVSGATLKSQPIVKSLKDRLAAIAALSKLSQIQSSLKTAIKSTDQLSALLTGNDQKAVKSCASFLAKARSAKTVSSAKSNVVKGSNALNKLSF